MSDHRFERPELPPDYDDSRARARRRDPGGWRYDEPEIEAVRRVIAERRDIRRFRPDPLPDGVLMRLLDAAHRAPSVGLMQPWRFVVIESEDTMAAMHAHVARERLVQNQSFSERSRHFLELKIEGIREAPLSICVCCDRGSAGVEVLGRHTIRDADIYSTCCAIENLWLAARAEGIGVGWVSFYRPEAVRALLGLPDQAVPVAWLCIGYPDERPSRPGLEAAGWDRRKALAEVVFAERWGEPLAAAQAASERGATSDLGPRRRATGRPAPPAWLAGLARAVRPADHRAALAVRDASDELVKPAGSLGALEQLLERWAAATGAPPSGDPRFGVVVFAADHGVADHGVSLYPARVSAQVAAAAARGETAIGVLARALGAELLVADVGLREPPPATAGVRDLRVAAGSADITRTAALSDEQLRAALLAGHAAAGELAQRCDALVVGEIGIGNTTVASALLAGLTGIAPERACGRGTGLDAAGLRRKRALVAQALAANEPDPDDPLECLRRLGGLELAALVGALLGGAAARRAIVLDGFATGVAALAACRLAPATRDYLFAGHRSSEPAHELVLVELGLEPLLDLRLRLGEASGAALALPLIALAGSLQSQMRTFDEAGVDRSGS